MIWCSRWMPCQSAGEWRCDMSAWRGRGSKDELALWSAANAARVSNA
jgi:hypothetical protein